MIRNKLFMSGEASVTITLVFSYMDWEHLSTPTRLLDISGAVRRENRPNERIESVIHYCDVTDKSIEEQNLKAIISSGVKCWPNPHTMLRMIDRHTVISQIYKSGLINHKIIQEEFKNQINSLNKSVVIKTGTDHRGIGKFLVKPGEPYPAYEGLATIEPYFEGESVRVMVVGQSVFGFKVQNDTNWIKNAPGANIYEYKLSNEIIEHAKKVNQLFHLDVYGVDYIVNNNGEFHFLEINQYPSFGALDSIRDAGVAYLRAIISTM